MLRVACGEWCVVWISRDSLMKKLADFGGLGGVSHYGWMVMRRYGTGLGGFGNKDGGLDGFGQR